MYPIAGGGGSSEPAVVWIDVYDYYNNRLTEEEENYPRLFMRLNCDDDDINGTIDKNDIGDVPDEADFVKVFIYIYPDIDSSGNPNTGNVGGIVAEIRHNDTTCAADYQNGTFYYHYNHRGDVIAVSENNGTIVFKADYDAYGKTTRLDSGTFAPRYTFSTKRYFKELGLYYYGYRWYLPELGRWTTKDPIGLVGGTINIYEFCNNNSIIKIDSYGLCAESSKAINNDKVITLPNGEKINYPNDVNIDNNIIDAQHSWDPSWFYDQVKNGGPWDYKQSGSQYEDFGNLHYGIVGAAFGFSENTLLREAGRAQIGSGTSNKAWGEPGRRINPWGGTKSYGDDPKDQMKIKQGIAYYNKNY